jgi:hypothetical protein
MAYRRAGVRPRIGPPALYPSNDHAARTDHANHVSGTA